MLPRLKGVVATGLTTGGSLQVDTLTTLEELVALGDAWDDLVRAMPRPTPFLLRGWLEEWWRHYGYAGRLHVETVAAEGG